MRCPFCHQPDTRVVDSRLAEDGEQVRRRRECIACKERFTTYEAAELTLPRVIKADGRREPFMEEKLRAGLVRALQKRPVPTEKLDAAIARIKRKLLACGEKEVPSRWIGDWAMEQLHTLDQVAYVRFASVYRSFDDVRAFLDEIEQLEKTLPPEVKKDQLKLLPTEKN